MMSKKQYEDRKAELEKEFREKLNLLAKTYAAENNPYRIGETIRDRLGSARIETVSVYMRRDGMPECVYFARTGKGRVRVIYQSNVIKHGND